MSASWSETAWGGLWSPPITPGGSPRTPQSLSQALRPSSRGASSPASIAVALLAATAEQQAAQRRATPSPAQQAAQAIIARQHAQQQQQQAPEVCGLMNFTGYK